MSKPKDFTYIHPMLNSLYINRHIELDLQKRKIHVHGEYWDEVWNKIEDDAKHNRKRLQIQTAFLGLQNKGWTISRSEKISFQKYKVIPTKKNDDYSLNQLKISL